MLEIGKTDFRHFVFLHWIYNFTAKKQRYTQRAQSTMFFKLPRTERSELYNFKVRSNLLIISLLNRYRPNDERTPRSYNLPPENRGKAELRVANLPSDNLTICFLTICFLTICLLTMFSQL
jgi:hypothetical protein